MGSLYSYMLQAGFSADYLDRCTLPDLDLFVTQTNRRREKEGWKRS